MEKTKQVINQILELYKKYSEYMGIKPILTLTRQEQKLAIGDRYDDIITRLMAVDVKKAKYYNKKYYDRTKEDLFGQTDYKRKGYNDVIFLHLEKFTELFGLHHYTEPKKITKKVNQKYIDSKGRTLNGYTYVTYLVKSKIGHLEETLIHELVHVKYPGLRHGDRFNQIVRNIYLSNNKGINEKQK